MRTRLIAACLLLFSANAQASTLVYEFVEESTNDTLAYWELSSLPASYEDVVSLTFTPEGVAIFGLGEVYAGDFDHVAVNTASDDGMGGLGDDEDNPFGAWIFDGDDVPISTRVPDSIGQRLSLLYMNDPGLDRIWYSMSLPLDGDIVAWGDWRLVEVPEPSSFALAAIAMLALCYRR